ncbi:16S rRNA (cytosine(1402)-N(4))-methyltransferase RsmH [Patescibacteria group bacterium]|nr:16S rRNA (cytosine(1402)-N(4))-methyltransferase RsmH [Patescibacteria group bacterium]MBU2036039.1 16S rRNA (cytosine(1402)-N(4))-methyltransferase RsmH [Patescibacteria group bacterium]
MKQNKYHEPVLKKEILDLVEENISTNSKIIDATLATGGHTEEFLKKGWKVLGIEVDNLMLEIAKERLFSQKNVLLLKGNFKDIDQISKINNFLDSDVILFDLGVSNLQLTSNKRGFSFSNPNADLDMRIDPISQEVKAKDLLNILREDQLKEIFSKVMNYNLSKKIVREIIRYREQKKIETVADFNQICEVLPKKESLNKATLAYLALRIAVNSELENLSEALPKAFEILKEGGILLIISFHSGEDRVVKQYFRSLSKKGFAQIFEVVRPESSEIVKNPRSRSAKLRCLKKL